MKAMMQNLMESQASLLTTVAELNRRLPVNKLDESFTFDNAYGGDSRFADILPQTPSARRKSILLQHVDQDNTTISSLTTVAVPKTLETKAIFTVVDFLSLRDLQQEYAIWKSDPGSRNQQILLWNNRYMSQLTRDRVYRRLEAFNNIYLTDDLLKNRYPDWRLPGEDELHTKAQDEILKYLEISIIPHNPHEYERALEGIISSEIDHDKVTVSPAGCLYYLGKMKRAIELVRLYTEIVPESHPRGTKDEKLFYNLGVRKQHSHNTRGTIAVVNDSLMPQELRVAFANFAPPPGDLTTMSQNLDYLYDAVSELQRVYDKLGMWLKTCHTRETRKKKDTTEPKLKTERHRANNVQFGDTPPRMDDTSADTVKDTDDEATLDLLAATETAELKKTPCYAFIDGKCNSGSCTRSHDKKQIATYLADKQKQLQGL